MTQGEPESYSGGQKEGFVEGSRGHGSGAFFEPFELSPFFPVEAEVAGTEAEGAGGKGLGGGGLGDKEEARWRGVRDHDTRY